MTGEQACTLRLGTPTRRQPREAVMRLVEYSPFPRAHARQNAAIGFTHDISPLGMCLAVEQPQPAGSLLHVILYALDGRPALDSIARVTRWQRDARGRFWLGIDLLDLVPGPAALERPRLRAVRSGMARERVALA